MCLVPPRDLAIAACWASDRSFHFSAISPSTPPNSRISPVPGLYMSMPMTLRKVPANSGEKALLNANLKLRPISPPDLPVLAAKTVIIPLSSCMSIPRLRAKEAVCDVASAKSSSVTAFLFDTSFHASRIDTVSLAATLYCSVAAVNIDTACSEFISLILRAIRAVSVNDMTSACSLPCLAKRNIISPTSVCTRPISLPSSKIESFILSKSVVE